MRDLIILYVHLRTATSNVVMFSLIAKHQDRLHKSFARNASLQSWSRRQPRQPRSHELLSKGIGSHLAGACSCRCWWPVQTL